MKTATTSEVSYIAPFLRGLIVARGYRTYGEAIDAIARRSELGTATIYRAISGTHSPTLRTLTRLLLALDATTADMLAARPVPRGRILAGSDRIPKT